MMPHYKFCVTLLSDHTIAYITEKKDIFTKNNYFYYFECNNEKKREIIFYYSHTPHVIVASNKNSSCLGGL